MKHTRLLAVSFLALAKRVNRQLAAPGRLMVVPMASLNLPALAPLLVLATAVASAIPALAPR